MEKIISILNNSKKNEDEKINFDFEKQKYFFCCTYCFKITKGKSSNYLGLINPNIFKNDHLIIKNDKGKMLDPRKRNNRYLAIIRHGERIDSTGFKDNQELPKFDPELTYQGMIQAINIGNQLRNLFRYEYNLEINELNIFTSPSTRTMQTRTLPSLQARSTRLLTSGTPMRILLSKNREKAKEREDNERCRQYIYRYV